MHDICGEGQGARSDVYLRTNLLSSQGYRADCKTAAEKSDVVLQCREDIN